MVLRRRDLLKLAGISSFDLSSPIDHIQDQLFGRPPTTSLISRWYSRSEINIGWPPANVEPAEFMSPSYCPGNSGVADLTSIDISQLKLKEKSKVLSKTESWEVGDSAYLPGYPSVVKNNVGINPDGKFYIFYAVHDPPSGIACAISQNITGPYIKRAIINPDLIDSRVLVAPVRPRGTSHFSSPVVIWNPETSYWHMYFHFYRDEISRGLGQQKTALARTRDLSSANWQIFSDESGDYITPFLANHAWSNSQSSYHAVARLPDGRWFALIRGVTINNQTSSLGFAGSLDGIRWTILPPEPSVTTNIARQVVKPVGIACVDGGAVQFIWAVYDKLRGDVKAYMAPPGALIADRSKSFLEGWSPGDGAASFWRQDQELHVFSANYRYVFSPQL